MTAANNPAVSATETAAVAAPATAETATAAPTTAAATAGAASTENLHHVGQDVVVSIRGLMKNFGDLHVLKGVDLDVHRGEVVVILGPSGSGKSTMLRCINRLEEPTSGQIFF